MHMPAKQDTIDQNDVAVDVTVMRNMAIRHKHVAIADPSDVIFLLSATVNRDTFTKDIVITNFDRSSRLLIADILRLATNDTAGEEAIANTKSAVPGNDNVTLQLCEIAKCDVRANDTKRANFYTLAQRC